MAMLLLSILVIALLVAATAARGRSTAAPPPAPSAWSNSDDSETPTELSLRDPIEALIRYGTPADAARLTDQGADLSALGYRPPPE